MSTIVRDFSTTVPHWRPRLKPVNLDQANAAQREALKETPSNTPISDYVLVLAHDPESLKHRTPLFNDIMYHRGGLSRAERELGATVASVVNHCVYCAAVHASRYNQLSKNDTLMAKLFAAREKAELEPRPAAILGYAIALSKTPSTAGPREIQALREVGLSDEEILDLTLATALFGWANRLMHTLGEPVEQAS